MKRLILLLVIGVMVGCLIASGCGNGADQAKEIINNAYENAPTQLDYEAVGNEVVDVEEALNEGKYTEAQFEEAYQSAKKAVDGLLEDMAAANDEYEKVLDMNDVEEYKDLVKVIVKRNDLVVEAYTDAMELMEKQGNFYFTEEFQQGNVDPETEAELTELATSVQEKSAEIQKLNEEVVEKAEALGFEFD